MAGKKGSWWGMDRAGARKDAKTRGLNLFRVTWSRSGSAYYVGEALPKYLLKEIDEGKAEAKELSR